MEKKAIGQDVYAVKLLSEAKREQSQSGGAFTAIAEWFLEQNGIVYGVALNAELCAVYKRIDSKIQLNELKGSKYVQAILRGEYAMVKQDLKEGRAVLFSGTPCHVAGLQRYLEAEKVDITRLFTCDLICHGVGSPKLFKEHIKYLEESGKKVVTFNFRDKQTHGSESYKTKGRYMVSSNWAKIYYSDLALREACYTCSFASTLRVGDITVGDYWGIEKNHPMFDDGKGVSLMIVNSDKGKDLFERIKENLIFIQTSMEECIQPALQYPVQKPSAYEDFWECYHTEGFENAVRKYCDYKPEDDWEKLYKYQYIGRIRNKLQRILKRRGQSF